MSVPVTDLKVGRVVAFWSTRGGRGRLLPGRWVRWRITAERSYFRGPRLLIKEHDPSMRGHRQLCKTPQEVASVGELVLLDLTSPIPAARRAEVRRAA